MNNFFLVRYAPFKFFASLKGSILQKRHLIIVLFALVTLSVQPDAIYGQVAPPQVAKNQCISLNLPISCSLSGDFPASTLSDGDDKTFFRLQTNIPFDFQIKVNANDMIWDGSLNEGYLFLHWRANYNNRNDVSGSLHQIKVYTSNEDNNPTNWNQAEIRNQDLTYTTSAYIRVALT